MMIRPWKRFSLLLLALSIIQPALAAEESDDKAQPVERHASANPNKELRELFNDDQATRQNSRTIDWESVAAEDAERRRRVSAMLADGELSQAIDYYRAAFIFQHGSEPNDYLRAHDLAMIAMALGFDQANWIAAATLDRFLMSIDRPQIYGTQYMMPPGAETTQEPYNRTLVSDAERAFLGVPSLEEQQNDLSEFQR